MWIPPLLSVAMLLRIEGTVTALVRLERVQTDLVLFCGPSGSAGRVANFELGGCGFDLELRNN